MSDTLPTSGNTPAKKMMLPALPRINTAQAPSRSQMTSSPMRPSPLRESTVSELANSSITHTPSATPPETDLPKTVARSAAPASLTPPDSVGPVIVDGSRTMTSTQAATPSNVPSLNPGEGLKSAPWPTNAGEFVKSTRTQSPEDPFLTTPGKPTDATEAVATTPVAQNLSRPVNASGTPQTSFSPRIDRLGEPISAHNAQGLLAPQACVFVANLSNRRTDDQLEFSVEQLLLTFGKCHVKILRDINKMPYAFAQFENVEDASLAIREARGIEIDGRPIRTELAKVPRSVLLSRITGGRISAEEARGVLEMYGAIEDTYPINIQDQQTLQLPDGIWVKFAFFQDCRDALSAFRYNAHYRLIVLQVDEQKPRAALKFSPSPRGNPRRSNFQVPDPKAIFVSNLPPGATEAQLVEIFTQYGRVISVSITRKHMSDNHFNTFAFIGFQTGREAQSAVVADIKIAGWPTRIEQKRQFHNGNSRSGFSPQSAQKQHAKIFSKLHRNGLEMGLPPVLAAKILQIEHHPGQGNYGNASNFVNSTPIAGYGNISTMAGYGTPSHMTGYGNNSALGGYGNGTPIPNYGHGTPNSNYGNATAMSNYGNATTVAGYGNHSPLVNYGSSTSYESYGNNPSTASYGNPSSIASYMAPQYSNQLYSSPMPGSHPGDIPSPTPTGQTHYAAPSSSPNPSSNLYGTVGHAGLASSTSAVSEANDVISASSEHQE